MSLEQDLQAFILSKYKSINQFAISAGIPYTTVKGGLERGIMGMSIQNVIKMCRTLNIDVDKLSEKKIEPVSRNVPLDANEFNLINQYRVVDEFGKKLITDVATHEYQRCVNTHQLSIASRVARSFNDESKPTVVEVDKSKYINAPENDIDM